MELSDVYSGWFGQPLTRAAIALMMALVLSSLVRVFMKGTLWRLISNTKTSLDDDLFKALEKPISTTIILVGLGVAVNVMNYPEYWSVLSYRVFITIGIAIWSFASISVSSLVVVHLGKDADPKSFFKPRIQPVLLMLIKIIVLGGATYFVFDTWDKNISGWLASAGVVGIAIGFAAKDTLANLFSGVFILADAPYTLGDYIVLGNGQRGRVTQIGLRSTRILTRDDIEIIMPNALMGNSRVINESGGPHLRSRVRIAVSVAYGSDVDQVRELLQNIAEEDQGILSDPAPRVRFRALGESGLDFQLMGWISKPELRGRVIDSVLTRIYKEFMQQGIEIPYPKRDLYVHQVIEPEE